jgi:hypothetical protein
VVPITMLIVHRVRAEEIPAGQGGTVIAEFSDAQGKFIGFVNTSATTVAILRLYRPDDRHRR